MIHYLDFTGGYQPCHSHLRYLFMTKYENTSSVEIQAAGLNKKPIISLRVYVHEDFAIFSS